MQEVRNTLRTNCPVQGAVTVGQHSWASKGGGGCGSESNFGVYLRFRWLKKLICYWRLKDLWNCEFGTILQWSGLTYTAHLQQWEHRTWPASERLKFMVKVQYSTSNYCIWGLFTFISIANQSPTEDYLIDFFQSIQRQTLHAPIGYKTMCWTLFIRCLSNLKACPMTTQHAMLTPRPAWWPFRERIPPATGARPGFTITGCARRDELVLTLSIPVANIYKGAWLVPNAAPGQPARQRVWSGIALTLHPGCTLGCAVLQ